MMDERPSPAALRSLMDYDPETGHLVWKVRPDLVGKAKAWNARYAGQQAGTIDKDGYRVITIHKRKFPAHVLAWVIVHGEWPTDQIDHKNCLKGDNRLENLREANSAQNGWNVGLTKRNKSGVKGVSWHKGAKKWMIHFTTGGTHHYYGVHDDFDLVVVIAAEAMAKHHGEYVRLQ